MISILIKNAIIVTVNSKRDIIWNGAIAINGDRIIDIGDSDVISKKYTDVKETIDARNKIIFPGLINTHNHLVQTLSKGLGDDMQLSQWLQALTTPTNICLTEEECYSGAMLGCIESLHSGVTTNMYLASGVAPVSQMLKKGIKVSLGLDGAASNNSQDMIENMKCTALLHKVNTLNPQIITAEKVLEMATIDGAESIGLEKEIGSLEINKKADLFIFNPYLSAKSIPMHNPVSTLLYSSSMENVETVVINGEVVLRDKKIPDFNYNSFYKNTQKVADNLAKRAGITNRREGHTWNSFLA